MATVNSIIIFVLFCICVCGSTGKCIKPLEYYDGAVNQCSKCSRLCGLVKERPQTRQLCNLHCPDYLNFLSNKSTATIQSDVEVEVTPSAPLRENAEFEISSTMGIILIVFPIIAILGAMIVIYIKRKVIVRNIKCLESFCDRCHNVHKPVQETETGADRVNFTRIPQQQDDLIEDETYLQNGLA